MVILDTSIIIDHLRRPKSQSRLLKFATSNPKELLCLSVISLQELYEGQSTKISEREKDLLATIGPLKILAYTYDVAVLAGKIMRDLPRPIELADSAIAATAIINHASLFTLNPKDFSGILGLEFVGPQQQG